MSSAVRWFAGTRGVLQRGGIDDPVQVFTEISFFKSDHMYRVVQVAFGFGNAFFSSLIMLSVSLAMTRARPLFPDKHMIHQ